MVTRIRNPRQFIGIGAAAFVVVSVISTLYLGLLLLWLVMNEPLGAPEFELRGPLRQFFGAALAVSVVLWMIAFVPLVKLARRRPAVRLFLMMSGALAVLSGLAGVLLVLPATSEISNAGGLNPDFGHLLTYPNRMGALWLYLMTGVFPYTAGYLAQSRPVNRVTTVLLVVVIAAPLNYVLQGLRDVAERTTAP